VSASLKSTASDTWDWTSTVRSRAAEQNRRSRETEVYSERIADNVRAARWWDSSTRLAGIPCSWLVSGYGPVVTGQRCVLGEIQCALRAALLSAASPSTDLLYLWTECSFYGATSYTQSQKHSPWLSLSRHHKTWSDSTVQLGRIGSCDIAHQVNTKHLLSMGFLSTSELRIKPRSPVELSQILTLNRGGSRISCWGWTHRPLRKYMGSRIIFALV